MRPETLSTAGGEDSPRMGEIFLLALPLSTYRVLSDAAARRGQTFAELLAYAIAQVLREPSRKE